MSSYLWLPGTDELRRADFNDAHRATINRRGGAPEVVVQAVVFSHPAKGDHVIYVDVALLDEAGCPPSPVYEALARMLEQACSGLGYAAEFYNEQAEAAGVTLIGGHATRHKHRRLADGSSAFGARHHAESAAKARGTTVI